MTRRIYTHRVLALEVDDVDGREFVRLRLPDWVNVVPITVDGSVVVVRQHRHGIRAETVEIPGGMVDARESPESAAIRELSEETGGLATSLVSLGAVWPNPAIQDNQCHLFLATGVVLGTAHPDPDEQITVEAVPPTQILKWLSDGTIGHALVALALHRALIRWPV